MLWQAIAYSGKCIIDKKVTDTCSQYKYKTHIPVSRRCKY